MKARPSRQRSIASGKRLRRREDRDLHRVEPQDLDLVDDHILGLGHMVGPEQQVHAGFHGFAQNIEDGNWPDTLDVSGSRSWWLATGSASLSRNPPVLC